VHQYDTTNWLEDFRQSVSDACADRPETQGRRDAERQYLIQPAPNAIQWCVDPVYLNSPSLYEYTRSYQIVRDVFQLLCPVCNAPAHRDCWGKTRAELEEQVLLEWDPDVGEDVCPSCHTPRSDFEAEGALKRINALHLVCGQRAGKSITAAMIGSYCEHRILTIAHGTPGGLHAYFGLSIKDPVEMTFLASNEVQGQDTIWAKYRAFRRQSPWFTRYTSWVKDEEEHQDTPLGQEKWTYSEANKKIVNEHPDAQLIINSLNSNSFGARGRTRLFGGLDEVSFMQSGESSQSADEIFRAIENSLKTIRSRTKRVEGLPWLGLMCSVTSPRSKDDKGMRLLKTAKHIECTVGECADEGNSGGPRGMLAYHYQSWWMNPFEPRENFDDDYAKDPVGAERDFGANPPYAAHPLIHDVTRFRSLVVDLALEAACQFETPMFTESGHGYIGLRAHSPKPRFQSAHYIAFDAGKNFDAFSGACAHGETYVDPDTGATRTRTVFDWVFRILPELGTEVYYDQVYGVVKDLMQHMPISRVEFDRWNSTQLIQQIRKLGIAAEQKSLVNIDWIRFRQDAYAGMISMLPPAAGELDEDNGEYIVAPPVMHPQTCALYELEGLEEDPETQKVFNPRKGLERGYNSNDTAQVVVHVHKMVQQVGYSQKNEDRSRGAAKRRSEGEGQDYIRQRQGGVYNPGMFAGSGMRRGGGGRGW
jgi:hypothetical protein